VVGLYKTIISGIMPNACNVEESLIGLSTLLVVKINGYTSPEEYYMKEWQVLCASVAGTEPPQGTGPLDYARMNQMIGFCAAFPDRE
jgi:hypothetical protein